MPKRPDGRGHARLEAGGRVAPEPGQQVAYELSGRDKTHAEHAARCARPWTPRDTAIVNVSIFVEDSLVMLMDTKS